MRRAGPMKVGILGLGLAGAGLGMEVRAAFGQSATVVGFDEDPDRTRQSRDAGAIDETAPDVATLAAMPLVFVAVEPASVAESFRRLMPHLRPGAVVSDISPVKSPAALLAGSILPPSVSFVGSHPVEHAGPPTGSHDGRRVWCLTPGRGATPDAIATLRDLASAMDYRPLILTSEEHDLTVGGTRHLPFLARAALLSVVVGSAGWRDLAPFSATLAAEETAAPLVDELAANRGPITHWLGRMQEQLEEIRVMLATGDPDAIRRLLEEFAEHEIRLAASGEEPREPGFARRVAEGLFGDRLASIMDPRPRR